MRKLLRYGPLAVAAGLLLEPAEASADPVRSETVWGWALVTGSVVAGTTVTLYGLNIDCARDDTDCHRGASLAIIGGSGIASFGTLCGITLVQWGERRAATPSQKPASFSLELLPALNLSDPSREAAAGFALELRSH